MAITPLMVRWMRKKALITGITGQDGSYLAELLLGLGSLAAFPTLRRASYGTPLENMP